jgi:stage III sporulation protein SpoIIIAA
MYLTLMNPAAELLLERLQLDIDIDGWDAFLAALPQHYAEALRELEEQKRAALIDIMFDVGRAADVRFISLATGLKSIRTLLSHSEPVTLEEMQQMSDFFAPFDSENRATLDGCLHRISAIKNRSSEIVGLTIRIGRTIRGLVNVIDDILYEAAKDRKSILLLGKPGTGKTSMLRELSAVLASKAERFSAKQACGGFADCLFSS